MKLKSIFIMTLFIVGIFLLWQDLPKLQDYIAEITGGSDEGYSSDVLTTDNVALVIMQFDILDKSMLDIMYDKAIDTYKDTGKDIIRVESYYHTEPIFALSIAGNDSKNYVLEDIRRPEYAITSEIPVFDVTVDNITLTDKYANLTLDYMGTKEEFSDNIHAILITVLEYAGWVDKVILNFRTPDGLLKISTTSDSIMDSLNGGRISIEQEIISKDSFVSTNNSDTISHPDKANSVLPKDCADNEADAYNEYTSTYNKLKHLMDKGEGDTSEAQDAYAAYKHAKDCYESITGKPVPSK